MDDLNPAQWPSIDNASVWYASLCDYRRRCLFRPAILIQRWWRKQPLFPVKRVPRSGWTAACLKLRRPLVPYEHVYAYEKLDGTNLGVSDCGKVYGRRYRVVDNKYQGVPLTDIPAMDTVKRVKEMLRLKIGLPGEMPGIILYGELMCQPKKYEYIKREMSHSWFCFGLVFCKLPPPSDQLTTRLRDHGFFVSRGASITIRMNPVLAELLTSAAPSMKIAPLVDEGTLPELCARLKPVMMGNDMEGVVLSGPQTIMKWKNGQEDGSTGAERLICASTPPVDVLTMMGIDTVMLECMRDVACNRVKRVGKGKKVVKYESYTLSMAIGSALSKYDSPEVYFKRGEAKIIKDALIEEVVADLLATTKEEIKCVTKEVSNFIASEYSGYRKRT